MPMPILCFFNFIFFEMNIAIICYPTFGGSGVVATELGLVLGRKGHQVHFITYNQPVRLGYFNENVFFHEVHIEEYPLFHYQPYELALSSKIVEVVKNFNIQILHAHYAIPHAYAAFMAKQILLSEGINVKIITTLHGTDITIVGKHPYYKTAVNFSINASDIVTSVSESLKNDTLSYFEINKDKDIRVVPNFINLDKEEVLPKVCKRKMVAKDDEFVITHISNFRKVKRIDDVIKIFAEILKHKPAKLVMAGDGPEREMAEVLCQELGIQQKVIFLGNYLNISEILCFSDLFLLPSQTESFGLAALEAMALGVPVISSNAGGLPEVNIEGVTGFLSDVGDVSAMVKNALKILETPETLKSFKQNAKNQAQRFDENKIIPIYEELYNEVIK